jgi:hypothetical protein
VWRHIAQSLQGPSHASGGAACQDSNSVSLFGQGRILVACVADGAGSATFSDTGSKMACAAVMEHAAMHFEMHGGFDNLERGDALRWCEDARERIAAEAAERQCDCRELATTLSVAIASPECSVFFQIGDGAIIAGNYGAYGVVFWPQTGEYANSTNFLTAEDFRDRLDFLTTTSHCSELALLTDGLERLALQFGSQTPHAPFFTPLFRALRAADDVESLNEHLRQFLASDSVQSRSDDDKTLILATHQGSDDPA